MPPETTFLHGEALWAEIKRLSARPSRASAYLAIAYVGKSAPDLVALRSGDHLVADISEAALKSGQTSPDAIERYIKSGVVVHSHEGLHAKVYVLGRIAIIGSPNASRHSETGLLEAAARTTASTSVADARSFVKALEVDYGRIDLKRLRYLRQFYREPRRQESPTRGRGVFPLSDESVPRLQIAGISDHTPTEAESKVIASSQRSARRQAGPAASTRVETVTFMGECQYSAGDFLVQVSIAEVDDRIVYPPAEIVRIDHVTRRRHVIWLATPSELESITWSDLTRMATDAGFRLNSDFRRDLWIRSRQHRQALASSWPVSN